MSATPIKYWIERIKAGLQEERTKIAALHETLGDDLTKELKKASKKLDDIEMLFLDSAISAEPRSDVDWTNWLKEADKNFGMAVVERERVESLAKTYGPNAKISRS